MLASSPPRERVLPFPWTELPHVSSADARAVAVLRDALAAAADATRLEEAFASVLGARLTIRAEPSSRRPRAPLGPGALGLLFADPADDRPGARIFVALESALALAVAARVIGGEAPRIVDASRGPSPAVAGAVAAALAAVARRASGAVPRVVVAAGPEADLARDFAVHAPNAVSLPLSITMDRAITLDGETFRAALRADVTTWPSRPRAARTAHTRIGQIPIALPLVASVTVADRVDVMRLARGDVFVPRPKALAVGVDGSLAGPVTLVSARAEIGLGADLAPEGGLVIRRHGVHASWDPPRAPAETPMSDRPSTEATLTSLEDAPVVVRVEVGSVEMTAGAFAALEPGDVVALGRRLGDPATLRIGGVELARGELVVVDGEVGVRIVERVRA